MPILGDIEKKFDEAMSRPDKDVYYFIDQLFLLQFSIIGEPGYEILADPNETITVLARLFRKIYPVFEQNPEFLFSIGYMLAVCDYCYELEGVELSHSMLRRAAALEPENPVYEWGVAFSTSQPNAKQLSEELAENKVLLDSLSKKGECFQYLAEMIANTPYFFSLP